ncbi:MAG: hypothetical protein GXO79_05885 [Chlorobi bacterium]|nr:hypothetical protein [Chlorobiota bacterium]
MHRLFVYFIIFFFGQFNNPQIVIKEIKINSNFLATDHFRNFYIIKDNQLLKYDKEGNYISDYSNSIVGTITSIDVSDPQRILLFYEDFNQLIFLDNKLAEIGSPILLDDLSLGNIILSCSAEQGGFWIFDQTLQQLLYFNKNLALEYKSNNIRTISNVQGEPNFLLEKNSNLYLNIPETGILIFNNFGFFTKLIPIKNLKTFQVINQNIIYNSANSVIQFNRNTFNYDTLYVASFNNIEDIKLEQNIGYIRRKEFVDIVKIK